MRAPLAVETQFLATNPIIRLLTQDNPDHAARSKALSVAHMERLKITTIVSFDRDFDRFPTIARQEPR